MTTWADLIRSQQSQTMGGRLESYLQQLDVGPLGYMNPAVRATARNWFDPMSSRYLMAAAPGEMGGYSGWATGADRLLPEGSAFSDYLGAPLRYGPTDTTTGTGGLGMGGAFGYTAAPTTGQDVSTGAGYLEAFRPWNREQWAGRLGQLDLRQREYDTDVGGPGEGLSPAESWTYGAAKPLEDLTDVQRDYLGMYTMPEAQSVIRGATMTGMNPIAQRAYRTGLDRSMSAWAMANPELGGGELLRQFATGRFTDPAYKSGAYMPGLTGSAGGTQTFL